MYDGPNYNPPDVQRHAPGQPPVEQVLAKATHDAAAWYALQEQKSPAEPLTEDDLRALMATIVYILLGGSPLGRYFANRIRRGPTPRLPRPVQASTTQRRGRRGASSGPCHLPPGMTAASPPRRRASCLPRFLGLVGPLSYDMVMPLKHAASCTHRWRSCLCRPSRQQPPINPARTREGSQSVSL
jgi:hypothetical protein